MTLLGLFSAVAAMGRPWWSAADLGSLLIGLVIDLVALGVLINVVYLPDRGKTRLAFLFVTVNLVVFAVSSLAPEANLGLWFALGVLVVAGFVEVRESPRDLAYLLTATALGLLNGLAFPTVAWFVVIVTNLMIVGAMFAMANIVWRDTGLRCRVTYDNVENLHRDRRAQLYWDLWERLGLDVLSVNVNDIDLASGTAELDVRYKVADTFAERVSEAVHSPKAS